MQYAGALYHVMNRGDRREAVFQDPQDYELFLETPAEPCGKAAWQVQAYCLMFNHFHEWGICKDSPAGRRQFAGQMERRRSAAHGAEFRPVERDWCLGGEEFRRELLEQVSPGPGASPFGELVQASVAVRAERLVKDKLRARGWSEQDLAGRRKGDPEKVQLAAELRRETTLPMAWIARRLAIGSRGYLTWLLHRQHGGKYNMTIPLTDPLINTIN